MHTTYRLNTSELDQTFLDGLRAAFPEKEIEIVVYEVDETVVLQEVVEDSLIPLLAS